VSLEKLSPRAFDLARGAPVARLAFLDGEDRPRVLPVTFAIADGAVWTAIDHKPKRTPEPARVRWLRRRPEAALCIDEYSDDWDRLAWVQLLGRVDVLELAEGEVGVAALTAKYAPYRELPPPGPLLRLEVERALEWSAKDYGE
jgi:PPOX class probable F420-dependent enzyme